MKRILCFLLALLMLASCFVACGDNKPAETDDSVVTTAPVVTTEPEELPNIELTGDYGDYTFNILSAGNQVWNDFDFQEESSLPLDNAQYKRKLKVEEDYEVKIVHKMSKGYSSGSSGSSGPGYKAVNKQVQSGDNDYDFCIIAGYDVSVLAYSGMLYDLASIKQIGLDKSWWDQNATESLSMKDVAFFTTGEITVSDNRAAFCLMFNKELLANYNLDSPYDMVEDGTWTIENFGTLVKSVSEDMNQDGLYTHADRYGLLVWDDSIVGIVNAAGQRCCIINDAQELELSFYNETTLAALEQYADIAYNEQYAFQYQRVAEGTGRTMWQADQALFFTTLVDLLPEFREMESDFGVLPYPKLTETQDTYYTTIAPFNSNFVCVPLIQDDVDRTGTIMEALAYYGKKIVTPALYDVTLIGQSTRDEESEPMLEIIFDNLIYDIGYYYQIGPYNKELIYKLRARDPNFTSMYESKQVAAKSMLNLINSYYQKAVNDWHGEAAAQ